MRRRSKRTNAGVNKTLSEAYETQATGQSCQSTPEKDCPPQDKILPSNQSPNGEEGSGSDLEFLATKKAPARAKIQEDTDDHASDTFFFPDPEEEEILTYWRIYAVQQSRIEKSWKDNSLFLTKGHSKCAEGAPEYLLIEIANDDEECSYDSFWQEIAKAVEELLVPSIFVDERYLNSCMSRQ